MSIKPQAFLALEASLALRLNTTLETLTSKLFKLVQKCIDNKEWVTADRLMRSLDLSPIYLVNEEYIKYLSNIAILFGASRVTPTPGTSAVGLGFAPDIVSLMVQSFKTSIEHGIKDSMIETGLQLIATAQSPLPANPTPTYLGTVLKAAKPSALLPFASFMGQNGRSVFNMASSLHTSRLSAFGYTAEAEYLGVTQYQITEQLDGRTCNVCAHMHRKIFNVSDARNLLDVVIRTQDPDELKGLQPWPSQSKESLAQIKDMSSAELVAQGWHVPPFHPRCRGLLTRVGTSPVLTAGKPAPSQPEQYVATASDFTTLGINLSPKKIELWNQLMQSAPAEVVASLIGTTSDKLLSVILGADNPQEILGLTNLSVTSTGVNLELQTSVFGSKSPVKQDYYFKKDQSLYVGLIESTLADSPIVRKVLRNLYDTAQNTSMKSMQMVADSDMGGYALPKYGVAPNVKQWGLVKSQIRKSLEKQAMIEQASELEQKALQLIMDSGDPKSIFALADLPSLGELLLNDTSWVGSLDFNDAESIARFISMVGGL